MIIGSGIGGLSLAIKLSELGSVVVITKKHKADSNTNYAQGGVAAVLSENDSYELHINDTLECGAGLCNVKAVEKIVKEGPLRVNELIDFGVKFSKSKGEIDLGKEGGHSRNRIIHAKDLTGKEIEKTLLKKISQTENIKIYEFYFAIDLLTRKNLRKGSRTKKKKNYCYGVYAYNVELNKVEKIVSNYTILATGGAGQVYLHTTNPQIATADGIAMGFRAGCKIANMEFIQFHPTGLYEKENNGNPVFLISEAVRGAGAVLKTRQGKTFMQKYDKRQSLAPRDIVARAIDAEMKKYGDPFVYLDLKPIGAEKIKKEFPNIYKVCLKKGIDITKEMIPVVPAAHYSCGGIKTNLKGRTNIKNLYACGEVASTGVHGANRLASNSLLEAMVFSNSIYEDLKEKYATKNKDETAKRKNFNAEKNKLNELYHNVMDWNEKGTVNAEEQILISHNVKEIKSLMSDYVGIVRNTMRLQRALRRLKLIRGEIEGFYKKTKVNVELLELRNLATAAMLIVRSALKRKESRGLHYMLDYRHKNNKKFLKDTVLVKS